MGEPITDPIVTGAFRVDIVADMTIEWDVPIAMDDGNILRADVFRPTAYGRYPVILSCGPYAKGTSGRRGDTRKVRPNWRTRALQSSLVSDRSRRRPGLR